MREDRGPWYIREALRRDGVDDALIDAQLSFSESEWRPRLQALIERRGLLALPAWPDRARAGERLVRRGFAAGWVSALLRLDS